MNYCQNAFITSLILQLNKSIYGFSILNPHEKEVNLADIFIQKSTKNKIMKFQRLINEFSEGYCIADKLIYLESSVGVYCSNYLANQFNLLLKHNKNSVLDFDKMQIISCNLNDNFFNYIQTLTTTNISNSTYNYNLDIIYFLSGYKHKKHIWKNFFCDFLNGNIQIGQNVSQYFYPLESFMKYFAKLDKLSFPKFFHLNNRQIFINNNVDNKIIFFYLMPILEFDSEYPYNAFISLIRQLSFFK